MPRCLTCTRSSQGSAADALRFTILTASRQREVREMRWREVDLATGVLAAYLLNGTRPDANTSVPLSSEAIALLGPQGAPNELYFKGVQSGQAHLAIHLFGSLLNRACDPHGFRTSFAVWVRRGRRVQRRPCPKLPWPPRRYSRHSRLSAIRLYRPRAPLPCRLGLVH